MPETVMIHRTCPLCRAPSSVEVPREVVDKLNDGAPIQDAWPDSTADDREIVISGTHGSCYDEAAKEFADEEEEG